MIKKLLLLGSAVFAFTASVNAQVDYILGTSPAVAKHAATDVNNSNVQAKTATANVVDTLWYFYNKHFYRNPASTGFYTLKNSLTTSSTAVTQGGAIFKNSGSMLVSGAEAIALRQASSPSPTVNLGLFLYNVVGGLPTGAPIASVQVGVSTSTAGSFVGGNFLAPQLVTGDFAIMMQNISTNPADTLRLFIDNALQASATSTNTAAKYGEGLGVIQIGGTTFSLTTGLFISGGDLEFMVAPRVAYQASAGAVTPTTTPLCTGSAYTFSNTSSAWIGNRQFNLNQFAVQWTPFANPAATSMNADPVYVWAWGDLTLNTTTNGTVTSVSKTYNTVGTYAGTLTANIQKMSDYNNTKLTDLANFSKTTAACTGIQTIAGFENFNVYPNPTVNGKTNISGLTGSNKVVVYNMLGQVTLTQTVINESASIDLSAQPAGNYIIRITNSDNVTKTVKIINQ